MPRQQFRASFELRRVLVFLGTQVGKVFANIVPVFRGNMMPHRADFLNGLIGCIHVQIAPNNSGGVTKSGVFNPSMALIRRIWPNLLAFARCRQFHVTT